MFHVSDNLFFGRLPDGRVRLIKFKHPQAKWPSVADPEMRSPLPGELDLTLSDHQWSSIVAAVSAQGENGDRFYAALAFHNDVKRVGG